MARKRRKSKFKRRKSLRARRAKRKYVGSALWAHNRGRAYQPKPRKKGSKRHRGAGNAFTRIAAIIVTRRPSSAEDRVHCQEEIASANRRGAITNAQAETLLALMKEI